MFGRPRGSPNSARRARCARDLELLAQPDVVGVLGHLGEDAVEARGGDEGFPVRVCRTTPLAERRLVAEGFGDLWMKEPQSRLGFMVADLEELMRDRELTQPFAERLLPAVGDVLDRRDEVIGLLDEFVAERGQQRLELFTHSRAEALDRRIGVVAHGGTSFSASTSRRAGEGGRVRRTVQAEERGHEGRWARRAEREVPKGAHRAGVPQRALTVRRTSPTLRRWREAPEGLRERRGGRSFASSARS